MGDYITDMIGKCKSRHCAAWMQAQQCQDVDSISFIRSSLILWWKWFSQTNWCLKRQRVRLMVIWIMALTNTFACTIHTILNNWNRLGKWKRLLPCLKSWRGSMTSVCRSGQSEQAVGSGQMSFIQLSRTGMHLISWHMWINSQPSWIFLWFTCGTKCMAFLLLTRRIPFLFHEEKSKTLIYW